MATTGIDHASDYDWPAARLITACGVRVGLRASRPEALDQLMAVVPGIWRASVAGTQAGREFSLRVGAGRRRRNQGPRHQLYEDGRLLANADDLGSVLEVFEKQLKLYLAEMARRRVFVHAGAVGWRGKAIIFPGRSFSGKTSLVAELLRAGAEYYSDEFAVLDPLGRVHPYAAPLEVRAPGGFKQERCRPEKFGGRQGVKPLPVGLVVISRYKVGARWRPRALSAGQGMLELFANTVPARRRPEAVMATLQRVVAAARVCKGARGEAEEAARFILDW